MKKIIGTAVIGLAFLTSVSSFRAEAAQVNAGRGVGSNNLGYCLVTGEERVPQADCPIGQNKVLKTQTKAMTSEQSFLLAAVRQRPQDGTGYKNGRNGGTGQNAGNGKQDGTGLGCVDGPRVPDCPNWEGKQEEGTNLPSGTTSDTSTNTSSSQSNVAQASQTATDIALTNQAATSTQVAYGQPPQDGTGNQYGNAAANNSQVETPNNSRNNNSGQEGNQTCAANRGHGNGLHDRRGEGAGGQRGRNAGACITN